MQIAAILAVALSLTQPDALDPGISLRVYHVGHALERVAEPVAGVSPNLDARRDRIDFRTPDDFGVEDQFIAIVSGFLNISVGGEHTFRLTSDDGSMLLLDGERLIWNRGPHPERDEDGAIDLEPGLHPLRILYFENTGDQALSLSWKTPGSDRFELVPTSALRTPANVTRVISPGNKPIATDIEGLRSGDGIPFESSHPAWTVETIHPEGVDPMVGAMAFLPDGRLAIATFEPKNNGVWLDQPNGALWAFSNLDATGPDDINVTPLAEGLYHPLGMCVVDGDLYIAQRDEITRLSDTDGDGAYETRATVASGWLSDNYHHFTFGLVHHDGSLYATTSTSIGAGDDEIFSGSIVGANGPNPAGRGNLLKIDIATGHVTSLCGGFRTPNGILRMSSGHILVGENQGAWMPACKINHARPGAFYGHYNETRARTTRYPEGGVPAFNSDRPVTPPALWLPQNEICNSPTSMLEINDGPFAGQIYIGELKLGGIRRAALEEVNGVLQGAAFRFSQGFEGGVNRLLWAPDGSIIVGCIGERATWSWRGTRTGLQRLRPVENAPPTFEYHSISATESGFELRFTEPADRDQLEDTGLYELAQWRYVPTPVYGGPKVDEQELRVSEAIAAADNRSVRITVPGLQRGRCVYVHADLESDAGQRIWSPEAWYTLNEIPGLAPTASPERARPRLLVFSKTAGYRHGSIPDGVACFERLGREHGFDVVATEDAGVFNDEDLAGFDGAIFLSTTGDVLDLSQEAAFERFVGAGGGYLGIHAATDTEYDWPWYTQLVGAQFASHPKVQHATIRVLDQTHPATAHLSETWGRVDEWYDFKVQPHEGITVMLTLDESSYSGGRMGASHPIAWRQEMEGGARSFYTGGGHTKASFAEPAFVEHLLGAIRWITRSE